VLSSQATWSKATTGWLQVRQSKASQALAAEGVHRPLEQSDGQRSTVEHLSFLATGLEELGDFGADLPRKVFSWGGVDGQLNSSRILETSSFTLSSSFGRAMTFLLMGAALQALSASSSSLSRSSILVVKPILGMYYWSMLLLQLMGC